MYCIRMPIETEHQRAMMRLDLGIFQDSTWIDLGSNTSTITSIAALSGVDGCCIQRAAGCLLEINQEWLVIGVLLIQRLRSPC